MSRKLIYVTLLMFVLGLSVTHAQSSPYDRVAYWDSDYATSWAGDGGGVRDALEAAGYRIVDADELKTWMNARIADGKLSVVVFCRDDVPDTVAEERTAECTIRKYLDAGGKVVWYSDIPFYYVANAGGGTDNWATDGSIGVLGFNAAGGTWDSSDTVSITDAGATWGLTTPWTSVRPAAAGATDNFTVLATDDAGNAAAWVKHFVPGDTFRGFVRICDIGGAPVNIDDLIAVAEYIVYYQVARGPAPADGAIDVPQDTLVSWVSGDYAVKHDVYFGSSFEAVDAASRANPMGVLVSQDQTANTYDHDSLLELGRTYYWRIDEVNGAPDNTLFKGDVWSFTAEPLAYPVENITATASSVHEAGYGPEKTIDGSGLNASDQHSATGEDMWLSGSDAEPAWIQYEFDQTYKLNEMWVWNSNQPIEMFLGLGARDVAIEYSIDGVDWIPLAGVPEFAQASGMETYASNTTVDFGGVLARYVRLVINDNWGVLAQSGLSEVRFFQIPTYAREPEPVSGQMDVGLDAVLNWRPGRGAVAHEVYFSSDRAAVVNGTALIDTRGEHRYDLASAGMEYGQTYYWKINEINDAATPPSVEGDVWNFSTVESFVVDDMESYTDDLDAGAAIFQAWIDGWDNGSGATVGYFQAPFAEQGVVHGGAQSMPLDYNNVNAPWYSETERTWESPQDWTVNGSDVLTLYFHGHPVGFVETAPNQFTMGGAGADIGNNADEFRFAFKRLSGNGSIVARVDSVVNTNDWAKAGVMIRESLDADAKHGMVCVTPASGVSVQCRLIASDASAETTQSGLAAPYWVKLTRTGDRFTAERSADGVTWVSITNDPAASSVEIPMIASVYIGLAVTSHASGISTTAEFSNVAITGNVSGPWQTEAIGVAQPSNDPDRLYVALEDSAGHLEVVAHPDAEAVLSATWQRWSMPLSAFADAGVNTAKVERMVIGVGDRDNPTPAGAGLLFIDDIQVGHIGSSEPGDSGLVAYYALEDNAEDSSGHGHHGTAVGDPIYIPGVDDAGTALEFDGTGAQYVDLGTFNPSEATGQLSISLWARWNGLSGQWQGLIGKRDDWAANAMMWQIEANRDYGTLGFFREGSEPPDGDPVLPVGEWAHVAATFDGAIAKFYVNGEMTGEGEFSFGSDTEAAVQFGASAANGGNPFNGALDEIRLYDRRLSAFEIRYLAGAR